MTDYVVLVTDQNKPIGTMPKLEAHNNKTPLHRGFSVFLFNKKGDFLLQQRSKKKKTWPGVWTNSVCGHPKLEESAFEAAKRHLAYELRIKNAELTMMLPDYRYRCEKDGVVENEICPVMIAVSDQKPNPNPDEVEALQWTSWQDWVDEVNAKPDFYSPWCVEETKLLIKNKTFISFIKNLSGNKF